MKHYQNLTLVRTIKFQCLWAIAIRVGQCRHDIYYILLAGRLALLASPSSGPKIFGFSDCGRAAPASGISIVVEPIFWAYQAFFFATEVLKITFEQIFVHCGRRAQITILGKSIFLDYLQFILAIQASKWLFRAALCSKNTFSCCGRRAHI